MDKLLVRERLPGMIFWHTTSHILPIWFAFLQESLTASQHALPLAGDANARCPRGSKGFPGETQTKLEECVKLYAKKSSLEDALLPAGYRYSLSKSALRTRGRSKRPGYSRLLHYRESRLCRYCPTHRGWTLPDK